MTVLIVIFGLFTACAGNAPQAKADVLNGHAVVLDASGKIIPWTKEPGQAYGHVMDLAWDYLLNRVPTASNGKPCYYSYSYLLPDTQQPYPWPHNPAGLYGMLIESALKYYGYSGNIGPMNIARDVATAHLQNGMTPDGWVWPNVPYASGDAGSLVYRGAAYGNVTGQGDGQGVIQPDKVGELGFAWLQLYRFDGNADFRDAAIRAADALARNIRPATADTSPWPHRVYAQTGEVRENYNANVIGPIRLFDGLIKLGLGNTAAYQSARDSAWNWMMNFPMQNNIWSNYFEDDPIQPDNRNFDQYSAMMTARYLLEHPEYDADWEHHVRDLIAWVEQMFAEPAYGANSISEQMIFHHPMGSHTSRYASVNALLYSATGDLQARDKAYRALNWSTYMARPDGVVIDGPEVNNQWFTDGYGDYVRHFMTSLGAVPEWAPKGENHLVKTTSLIRSIAYEVSGITYTTADSASTETLVIDFTPLSVTLDGGTLQQRQELDQAGWTFDPESKVLRVRHDSGTTVVIKRPAPLKIVSLAPAPENIVLTVGKSQQMTIRATFADGSIRTITNAVWTSSGPEVASVSSSGLVTAVTPGTAVIYASYDGIISGINLTVQAIALPASGSTLWPATSVPSVLDDGPDSPVELGVKFRADSSGSISGIRFYKSATNIGPHSARLWSSNGTLLGTASFTNETAVGWQQADFATPVAVTANTIYIASYHAANGHYSYDLNYFTGSGKDSPPLHALPSGGSGANGVYAYGPPGSFPINGWNDSNYWVDVVFSATTTSADTTAPVVTSFAVPANSAVLSVPVTTLTAVDNTGVTAYLVTESSTAPLASAGGWSATAPVSYTFGSPGSKILYAWAKDAAGNVSAAKSATVIITIPVQTGTSSTIWAATAIPGELDAGKDKPIEVGVKFFSEKEGYISGIRFYKAPINMGTHTGSLWSNTGQLLARSTFTNEFPSGWQEVTFASPVPIAANTVYVASYHTNMGHYSRDRFYFAGKGVDNPPLHALTDGAPGGNGVFAYGSDSVFPDRSLNSSNYWVDVKFIPLGTR